MYGNVAIIMGKSKLKLFGLEILVSFEISTHAHPDSVAHCFWSLCGNSTTDSWGCARHNLVHRATTNCRSLSSSRLVDDLHLNSPRTSIKPLMVTSERLIMDQLRKIACLYVSVVFKNVANVANVAQACEVFHGFRRIAIPGSVPGGNREAWLLFGRGRVVWASLVATFHCRGWGWWGLWNRPIRGQLPATSLLAGYSGDGVGRSWDGMKAMFVQGVFVVWTPLKESLSRSEYSYVYIRIYRYV